MGKQILFSTHVLLFTMLTNFCCCLQQRFARENVGFGPHEELLTKNLYRTGDPAGFSSVEQVQLGSHM